ncbi:hypothetical protein DPSP01_006483 [Paraphaeosphaeria sporulosa]
MRSYHILSIVSLLSGPTARATSVFDLFDFEKNHISDEALDSFVSTAGSCLTCARRAPRCKTYPGDPDWPSDLTWKTFNTSLSGALIATIPEAAPCYGSNVSAISPECQFLTSSWDNSSFRVEDPTSIRATLYQGQTCLPPSFAPSFLPTSNGSCTLGGYPSYTVNVTSVAHIQLAVRFAKAHNIRFVIKNTGHDFLGKSTGMGALSVWTHRLKEKTFNFERYDGEEIGPAVRLGAGVHVFEAYELAQRHNVTVIGGEGKTVGIVGGYTQGGGHSPLSSLYGLSADQVLSISLVTASGRFLTANRTSHADLFWALRGGGGGTFAVVTSMVLKAHPQIKVTTMRYSIKTSPTFSQENFWKAMAAYLDRFEEFADKGYYSYFRITHSSDGEIGHEMASWVAPNTSISEFRMSIAPLLSEWQALGMPIETFTITEYDDFASAWAAGFPQEPWTWNGRQASRFFPRSVVANATSRAASLAAIRAVFDAGAFFIMFNMRNPPGAAAIDNAVLPAWRDVLLFAIMVVTWKETTPAPQVEALSRNLTEVWNPMWRALTPGSGTYLSEADYLEPGWQESFHGDKYGRLLRVKEKWDREGLFWSHRAVGSEAWEESEVLLGHLPSQNSRLCKRWEPTSIS